MILHNVSTPSYSVVAVAFRLYMSKTSPRIALVPHTAKQPERCPHCGSTVLTRKGIRKKRIEIVQLWRCGSCKRVFTPGPAALRNKTYPLRIALDALTLYNLGYSVDQTTEKIRSRYGRQVGRSTIGSWIAEHRPLTTYTRLRGDGRRLFPPAQAIRSIKLYHRQVYKFAYHRPKLALLRQDRQHARFRAIADFLERVPSECPHELFRDSERASQTPLARIKSSPLIITTKENAATGMAALVIPTVGDNRLRHEALQCFMLAADSATIAVEIPIWIAPATIAELEREHQVQLRPDGADGALTGHIDFLQIRNGAVHILDYKPDARTNRPIAQLTIYALALTKLIPGLTLFDIKCAWFNENEYCEFFPRKLFTHSRPSTLDTATSHGSRSQPRRFHGVFRSS
jgi:transposase-like protein